jgi:hypothetical protein
MSFNSPTRRDITTGGVQRPRMEALQVIANAGDPDNSGVTAALVSRECPVATSRIDVIQCSMRDPPPPPFQCEMPGCSPISVKEGGCGCSPQNSAYFSKYWTQRQREFFQETCPREEWGSEQWGRQLEHRCVWAFTRTSEGTLERNINVVHAQELHE